MNRATRTWTVPVTIAFALVTHQATAEAERKVSFKVTGVMRCLAPQSSQLCFARLMFQNRGKEDVIIPFEFASPRRPKQGQPYVSADVEHGDEGNASNLTTCATATCEWHSTRSKKVYRSVARVLNGPSTEISPGGQVFCTIEIPRPPKDFYKLHIHFDNRMIAEPTKMLADFNSSNPQFFSADDEVTVLVR